MFTKKQKNLINHYGCHAIVRAVAGSGKTTCLVALTKSLIERGVEPQRITFVVFNKDAKNEILERLAKHGFKGKGTPKVHTFHSLGYSLYKFLSSRGFTVFRRLETNDSFLKSFSQKCLNEIKSINERKSVYASKEESEAFHNFIDIVKSTLLSPEDVYDGWIGKDVYSHFIKAYDHYESTRLKRRFITYSDLIKDVVNICSENKHAKDIVCEYIDYLLMDEVQDINEISIELAKCISNSETNWVMVGDVDQCIYKWRGAEPEYLSFKLKDALEKEKKVVEFDLPESFRYGDKISLLANFSVSNNSERSSSLCISSTTSPDSDYDIRMYKEKGRFGKEVVKVIKEEKNKGVILKDISVLVRLYSFSSEIELELLKERIPYNLEGGSNVFDKREVNALMTILKISEGLHLDESDEHCSTNLNDFFSLCFFGVRLSIDAQQVANMRREGVSLSSHLSSIKMDNPSRFKKQKMKDLITSLKVLEKGSKKGDKPENILNTFLKFNSVFQSINLFSVRQEDYDNKKYTIESVIDFIKNLKVSVKETIAKAKEWGSTDAKNHEGVVISSIHRSKGREWPVVIIPGLEDGLFPYMKKGDDHDVESERRLFYVATTRCINRLYYICPQESELDNLLTKTNKTIRIGTDVSRFIYESRPDLVRDLSKNKLNENNPCLNDSHIGKDYIKQKLLIEKENKDLVL